MINLINSLLLFLLISCSSIDDPTDSKRNWGYLTELPIYEIQRNGLSFMNIIDRERNEVSTYWGGEQHKIFEPEAQYGDVSFYLIKNFHFALLGLPNGNIAYERSLQPLEFLLLENDIRENDSKEHQYENIILHQMDAFNKNHMNFIGWNNNRDSIFNLVVGHDFKEIDRYYLPISITRPITVQHFAVSESGKYLAIVFYTYPDTGGVEERIEVFETLSGKYIKIHEIPDRSEELIREFKFSKDERFLFLSDIKRGRIRQLLLGRDIDASIAYDPMVDYSKTSASPHVIRIPNAGNDLLIREIYGYIDDAEENIFNQEKMELIRYNPEQGVLNTYFLDSITIGRFIQGGFQNDSTFIVFERPKGKDYTYHEYRFDINNGFELKKSQPF